MESLQKRLRGMGYVVTEEKLSAVMAEYAAFEMTEDDLLEDLELMQVRAAGKGPSPKKPRRDFGADVEQAMRARKIKSRREVAELVSGKEIKTVKTEEMAMVEAELVFTVKMEPGYVFTAPRGAALVEGSKDAEMAEGKEVRVAKVGGGAQYRFMGETLSDRARIMEEELESVVESMAVQMGVEPTVLAKDAGASNVIVYGRIGCEVAASSDEKADAITKGNAVLQCWTRGHLSTRTHMSLNQLTDDYFLFMGEYCALEGYNPGIDSFIVNKIFPRQPLPLPTRDIDNVPPVNVMYATGPFTMAETFDFSPLRDVVAHALNTMPDVLVISGPFIPENHKALPRIGKTPQQLAADCLYPLLEPLKGTSMKVFIQPSLDDVLFDHCVLPQPSEPIVPFNVIPNPCMLGLTVNDCPVNIGIISHDILHDICKGDVCVNNGKNKYQLAAQHLIGQRSFYPVYPPLVNIEHSHRNELLFGKHTPDLLLFPSMIMSKAQYVENPGCWVVNAPRACKTTKRGQFLEVQLSLKKDQTSMFLHDL